MGRLRRVWDAAAGYFLCSDNFREKRVFALPFLLVGADMLALLYRYAYALIFLSHTILCNHVLYLAASVFLPYAVWAYSTLCDAFNYCKVKKLLLFLALAHSVLAFLQPVWTAGYYLLCVRILDIPLSDAMTKAMVLNLARLAMALLTGGAGFLIGSSLLKIFFTEEDTGFLDGFRLDRAVDMRKNRDSRYDCRIMRDQEGHGRVLPIYEQDLSQHMLVIGASGVGKTSSFITPFVIDLLNQKVKNRGKREGSYRALLSEGKAYVQGPVKDPGEYDIRPCRGHEKEFEGIRKRYPDCGISILSPNSSINDSVVRLCEARGLGCNVIDPAIRYKEKCVRHIGMQPFFVEEGMGETETEIAITNRSVIFSEILVSVNEAKGSGGDVYFRDLNTSVTTNVAIVMMAYGHITHTQVTFGDMQDAINTPDILREKCARLEEYYNTTIQQREIEGTKGRPGKGLHFDSSRLQEEPAEEEDAQEEGNMPRTYRTAIRYVKDDLLGRAEKMYDQVRGLRNIVNDVLRDPRVFALLNPEEAIDFDRSFHECQITLVNSALDISAQASTTIGLYYILNQKIALLRRPKDDRQPHFIIVDECAQYVHSWMEDAVALYRQYNADILFAFQSLAQLSKTQDTQYLRNILLTVGNIIVYGRISAEEMKLFETLGGADKIAASQYTDSESSIMSESPSHTLSRRVAVQESAVMSGSRMRVRGFQEVTWIGSTNGNVNYARLCKLSFADPGEYRPRKLERLDLRGYGQAGPGETGVLGDAAAQGAEVRFGGIPGLAESMSRRGDGPEAVDWLALSGEEGKEETDEG